MIPTAAQYGQMLDAAAAGAYALPAVNVTSSETMNAAIAGFAEAGSDGIVQVTVGGAAFAGGGDAAAGARALALFGRVVAERAPMLVAFHTDHCPPDRVADFLEPLIGQGLFHSHMFDGSTLPLEENLRISAGLLERCAAADVVLEVECGVVGGEEDGI